MTGNGNGVMGRGNETRIGSETMGRGMEEK